MNKNQALDGGALRRVVAYNPLGWDRREPVRLPVRGDIAWTVIGA